MINVLSSARKIGASLKAHKILYITIGTLMLLCVTTPASAGWLGALAALAVAVVSLLVASAAAVVAAPVVAIVAAVVGVVATVVFFYEQVTAISSGVPISQHQSSLLLAPQPPTFISPGALSISYQPLPVPGGQTTQLVTAANAAVNALNSLDGDVLHGTGNLIQDINQLNNSLGSVADRYKNLLLALGFTDPTFSQAEIDSSFSDIATSGLNALANDGLLNIGLLPTSIADITNYATSNGATISTPEVSLSQILDELGNVVSVPEPSSLTLIALGLAGLGMVVKRRKFG